MHDQIVPAPNSHQVRGGKPIETDGTVRLLHAGIPVWFAQAEVQRRYDLGKYATLHAYHGSEVRNSKTGGQMFVLSVKSSEASKFRDADGRHQQEFSYRGSYLSGDDLGPLADPVRSFEERALSAALADFGQGIPENAPRMLAEMYDQDLTIANLYLKAMIEEVPDMTTLEEALQPDMFERLRELPSFRDYEAKLEAKLEAKIEAKLKAEAEAEAVEKLQAQAAALAERARVEVVVEAERARVDSTADALIQFFALRDDGPSPYAISQIRWCRESAVLSSWLLRAYRGEKSAQIFPEP